MRKWYSVTFRENTKHKLATRTVRVEAENAYDAKLVVAKEFDSIILVGGLHPRPANRKVTILSTKLDVST